MQYEGPWCICGMRGSGVRERAGSQGALALTCSGGVGVARVPGSCSRQSPDPDRIPGPSPLPGFSAPLYPPPPPARLPGPPALSVPPRPPPTSACFENRSQKGKEVRTRARPADQGERWTPRGQDPGAWVPRSAVLQPPGFGDLGTHVAPTELR